MKHEGSLPCSQQPTTVPYSNLDASSSHLPTLFPQAGRPSLQNFGALRGKT